MGTYESPLDDRAVAAILASIGAQVRHARQMRGWYLADVAERLGLSSSVVCRMELARREPSLYQVISACAVLGMRFSDIVRKAEDEAFPLGTAPWDSPLWPGWAADAIPGHPVSATTSTVAEPSRRWRTVSVIRPGADARSHTAPTPP